LGVEGGTLPGGREGERKSRNQCQSGEKKNSSLRKSGTSRVYKLEKGNWPQLMETG